MSNKQVPRPPLSCGCKVAKCPSCFKCGRCGCDHDGHPVQEKLSRKKGRPRTTLPDFLDLCKWVVDAPCADLTGDGITTRQWLNKIDEKREEWKNMEDKNSFLSRYARELMGLLKGVSEGKENYEAARRDCEGLVLGGCTNLLGRMTLDLRGRNSTVFYFMREQLKVISKWEQLVDGRRGNYQEAVTHMRESAARLLTGVAYDPDKRVEKLIMQLISDGERKAEKLIMAAAEEARGLGREYHRERLLNVIQKLSYRVHPDPINFTKYNKGEVVIRFDDDLNRRDVARCYPKWFVRGGKLFMRGHESVREVTDFGVALMSEGVPVLGPPEPAMQYAHVRYLPSIPFRNRKKPQRVHIETLEKVFQLRQEKEKYDPSLEKEIEEALTDLPSAPTVLRDILVNRIKKVKSTFSDGDNRFGNKFALWKYVPQIIQGDDSIKRSLYSEWADMNLNVVAAGLIIGIGDMGPHPENTEKKALTIMKTKERRMYGEYEVTYAFFVLGEMGPQIVHSIRELATFAPGLLGVNINPYLPLLKFLMTDILNWEHGRLSASLQAEDSNMVITVSGGLDDYPLCIAPAEKKAPDKPESRSLVQVEELDAERDTEPEETSDGSEWNHWLKHLDYPFGSRKREPDFDPTQATVRKKRNSVGYPLLYE